MNNFGNNFIVLVTYSGNMKYRKIIGPDQQFKKYGGNFKTTCYNLLQIGIPRELELYLERFGLKFLIIK